MPGAYVLARYDFPGRRVVRALVTVPFVLPTIAVGAAFLALLGPTGPLGSFDLAPSLAAILLAHVFFNYAVVVRAVGGFWAHLDPRREEAARVLGASRFIAFRDVTLPLLAPAIASAASIVFLFTFTSFGVVLLLGGLDQRTLEVEIYRQTVAFLDLPTAAALVIVQLVGVIAVVGWFARAQRRRGIAQSLVPEAHARRPRTLGERLLVTVNLVAMGVLLGAPIAVLVWRSFDVGGRLSLEWYRSLDERSASTAGLVPPLEAVRNSLVFASIACVIAVVVGGLAAFALRSRFPGSGVFDTFLMLPLGTSAVTVGFGFLIALDSPPLDLRTSPLLIPIAQALVAIPFVVRLVLPALRSIDPRLRDAAAVLGASPPRVWREVDLPIVGRALLVAAAFSFAVSLGEFGATVFIVRPDLPTVPVAIFRALGRPGDASFGVAMALAVVLAALTTLAVLAVERLRVRGIGEF
jgi:thiamine transport system permease protein